MAATRSMGTTLVKTNGTPKTIADLSSIGEFGIENGEIDVTTLDSPNNFKEFIMGWKEAGEITLSGIMKSPDNFEDMWNYAKNQTQNTYRIELPNGTKFDFTAYVKMWKLAENNVDGVAGFTGSLRIVGEPTLTLSGGVSA